jgi:hypothetical protein
MNRLDYEPIIEPPDHLEPSGRMRQVDNKIAHVNGILAQLDLALAIIYRLLPRDKNDEAVGMTFDCFRTEVGPRAQIIRNGNAYDVSKRRVNGS